MVLSHIASILKLSLQTFKEKSRSDIFLKNLYSLKILLDKLTSEHVNLEIKYAKDETSPNDMKAPSTYINIHEDQYVNICIFILRPKMKIPLHNHPEMYGLLKVIAGKVRIKSFSLNTKQVKEIQQNESMEDEAVIAEKMEDVIIDSTSESCILEPNLNNLHEIESIDGPAAFVDILAPPYDTIIFGNGPRTCRYYKVVQHLLGNVYKLNRISPPSYFWSDSAPYLGPKLFNESVDELLETEL